ncbi:hypothetical protein [Paenimyroides baculatum]|uniref:hypothetical protein n=1 Tax=Paenimyroides baculatum TaxID=2608000 RepID=UPI00293902A3|nr:hypothetical protein [Paenimyroides baculatum]
MTNRKLYTVDTIAEFHRISGLPKPQHPLISLVDYSLGISNRRIGNQLDSGFIFYGFQA